MRYDVVFYMPAVGSLLARRSSAPAGGAERQVLMLAVALAERGVRTALIVRGDRDDLPGQVSGVHVIARPAHRSHLRSVGKLAEAAHIWRALWRAPAPVVVTRCAGVQVGLIGVFTRLTGRRLVYMSAALAEFAGRGLLPRRRDAALFALGLRLSDTVVAQTEEQRALCATATGIGALVIPSLVAPAEAAPRPGRAFLWVGRLHPEKGPLQYLELARACPRARFTMVAVPQPGHESLEATLRAGAAELENLELLPPRSNAAIGELIAGAVACVNTSPAEGMPNVLLEGWARGVPALALSHDPGGVIEANRLGHVAHGSPATLSALAEALWGQRHIEDGTPAQRCRGYIAGHHSPAAVAEHWERVIRSGPPSAAPATPGVAASGAGLV